MGTSKIFFLFLLATISFGACKTSVQTVTAPSKLNVLPFDIAVVPLGDTIDGGAFLSLTAKSSVESWASESSLNTIVGLSYPLWPGVITVSVDGNTLNLYQEDVTSLDR